MNKGILNIFCITVFLAMYRYESNERDEHRTNNALGSTNSAHRIGSSSFILLRIEVYGTIELNLKVGKTADLGDGNYTKHMGRKCSTMMKIGSG